MLGEVIDLVGAGDSFRAGLMAYITQNIEDFKGGQINIREAIQLGNLFASVYIKSPLGNRYGNIEAYEKMLKISQSKIKFGSFEKLIKTI